MNQAEKKKPDFYKKMFLCWILMDWKGKIYGIPKLGGFNFSNPFQIMMMVISSEFQAVD